MFRSLLLLLGLAACGLPQTEQPLPDFLAADNSPAPVESLVLKETRANPDGTFTTTFYSYE